MSTNDFTRTNISYVKTLTQTEYDRFANITRRKQPNRFP